jgi:protein phosphatase
VAVADGMGGAVAGEVASRIAIEAVEGASLDGSAPVDVVDAANQAVLSAVSAEPSLAGMGTTLTLALVAVDGVVTIAHVGDSRAYLHRLGELTQITRDHTFVEEMVARGHLSPTQAESHPRRHLLTRVLGMDDMEIDTYDLRLEPGDRLLLCSDGLTLMLPDSAIATALQNAGDVNEAAWALVEAANAAGGYDNTTVVVVEATP